MRPVATPLSTPTPAESKRGRLIGLLSAVGVLGIWSGYLVFSRSGVQSGLTAFDVTALRFMVAGLLVLPFAWKWWPRRLPLHAQALLALTGPGAIYTVLMYLGLSNSSAAYGGVFSNGTLPLFTLGLVLALGGERPRAGQYLAVIVIAAGAALVSVPGLQAGGAGGIPLFLAASAVLSIYIYGVGRWRATPQQALTLVTLPNALVFLPLWWAFLPSRLDQVEWSTIVFQAAFQGLGPGFLAVILFAICVARLGPTPTAGFSAAVPATAALLAIPVLSEVPVAIEWTGIAVVTLGLLLLLRR